MSWTDDALVIPPVCAAELSLKCDDSAFLRLRYETFLPGKQGYIPLTQAWSGEDHGYHAQRHNRRLVFPLEEWSGDCLDDGGSELPDSLFWLGQEARIL